MPIGGQPLCELTPEGGLALYGVNKTGAPSIKGMIVTPGGADQGFVAVPAGAAYPAGVVYDAGVPDGRLMRVVVSGAAYVLMKDGEAATRGYWTGVSADTAGRAYMAAGPPGVPEHNSEIGHCLEGKAAGTDVLARVLLHFN